MATKKSKKKFEDTIQKTAIHSISHVTKQKKKELWIIKNEYVYICGKFIYEFESDVRDGTMTLMGTANGTKKGALRERCQHSI